MWFLARDTSLESARKQHGFSLPELRAFMEAGDLAWKVGTDGAMRGVTYVNRHQVGQLRQRIGFSLAEAARRAGVSQPRFLELVEGVSWRASATEGTYPLDTVNAVIKRIQSAAGHTVEDAAAELGVDVAWVEQQIDVGTVRVSRAKWDGRRRYITAPMLERLRQALADGRVVETERADWLLLSAAAREAGVTPGTIIKWRDTMGLKTRASPRGTRYHQASIRACARGYWDSGARNHRAVAPPWYQASAGK